MLVSVESHRLISIRKAKSICVIGGMLYAILKKTEIKTFASKEKLPGVHL